MKGAFLLLAVLDFASGPVRTHDARIAQAMREGRHRSATFSGLMERVETSGLIVYVESGRCGPIHVLSCVSVTASAGGTRYVRVTIDTSHSRQLIVEQIAHELQHAVEIAGSPEVIDAGSLRALYRRIGTSGAGRDVFETPAAVATGRTVSLEYAAPQ